MTYEILKKYLGMFVEFFLLPVLTFTKSKKQININESEKKLQKFSPNPDTSCICKNLIKDIKYDLQIIIPAYNASKTITQCIDSVIKQKTNYKYYLIIINDGSTDNTKELLVKYQKLKNIKIINQTNKGFSGARNRGLEMINSRYIMFLDSDDFLCDYAIQNLIKEADNSNADIVEGGYNIIENEIISTSYQHKNNTKNHLYGYPWGKIFNNRLFSRIHFPEFYWFEDTILCLIIYSMTKKISYINEIVYNYRINPQGITQKSIGNVKNLDSFYITKKLLQDRKKLNLSFDVDFLKVVISQIVVNFRRLKTINNSEILKITFYFSNEIIKNYFSDDIINNSTFTIYEKNILKALIYKKYIAYKIACRFYRGD